MYHLIIPGRPEPDPDPGPESESDLVEVSREQLGRWVAESIARNRTVRRTTESQEALDRAVEVLHQEGDVVLAAGVLLLAAARVAGCHAMALEVLMQLMAAIGRVGGLDGSCRVCGRTRELGRPGRREWVEFDLCSGCAKKLKDSSRRAYFDSTGPGPGRDGH